jgi:small basic protein
LKLCKALLLPHFFYCNFVFSSLSFLDGGRLQVALNSCKRYVFGIRRFDHLSVHRDVLLGMPLFVYFDVRVLSFFFRLIRSERPHYR